MTTFRLRISVLLTCWLWTSAALPAQDQHNLLIVIADDMGVDQVGAYGEGGNPAANTTTIDGLAAQGILFRNAWAYPTCSPARATMMTGRYGYRTGIGRPMQADLSLQETTIPEALDARGSGYSHAWIGKWHLGGPLTRPNDAGWSHFAGLRGGGVQNYFSWPRVVNGQPTATSTTYSTTQMADDAIDWIQAQGQQPWVCVLAFNAPHTPFHVPPSALHNQTLTGTPQNNPVPHYKAAIEAMDTELGRVLSALGPAIDMTNVLFLGDNGTPRQVTELPFDSQHAKGTPFEGGVRVPMIFTGPAVQAAGREVDHVVSIVDIFATTLELAGLDFDPPFRKSDSMSFAPYLADPAAAPVRTAIYAESFDNNSNPLDNGFACIRNQTFKFIRDYDGPGLPTEELYNLINDPFEQSNLLGPGISPVAQAARDNLAAQLDAIRDTTGRFEFFGPVIPNACTGSSGAPSIAGLGTPRLGQTYQVQLTQAPPTGMAFLSVGASNTRLAGVPLPIDLQPLGGGPDCALQTSADVLVLTTTDASGQATTPVSIPNDPLLLAGRILHEWLILDPAAPNNPLGLVTTRGLEVTIGR